ncbi:MAG: serine/threonine protein kinase [Myxococcales bacterium]|nr:serine/threonine protein kinase [Myxococcales bacterium]
MDHEGPLICPRCRQTGPGPTCFEDGAWLVTRRVLLETGRDSNLGSLVAGRYGIVERLGVGGMGAVYKAVDTRDGRFVALKFLREQYARHPSIRQRFIREAEAALAVESPYVVPLVDFGVEADRTLWLAMAYVEGWTLRDEVNHNGPFGVDDIVQVARHTLLGLAAAHDVGLVHRDLKHDNIMFSGTRQDFVARILDFGVVSSRAADAELAEGAGKLTGAGVMVGSPSYMSPEQIRGLEVGPPADLYALAVVMYEAMTARRLFSVNNYEALVRAGARRDAPPLTTTGGGEPVPPALDRIMRRALAHDPDDRYPDARTMLLALDQMDAARHAAPPDLLADQPAPDAGDELAEREGLPLAVDATPTAAEPALVSLSLSDTTDLGSRATPTPTPAAAAEPPPAAAPAIEPPPTWARLATFAAASLVGYALVSALLVG